MKKLVVSIVLMLFFANINYAQRFAYVDTEYILSKIPVYKDALSKLDLYSSKWQKEIEDHYKTVERKFQEYQNEKVLLSDEMKKRREEEILNLEKTAKNLKKKYFGVGGELFKKREELIKPIQESIYDAIQQLATEGNYAVVFDTAGGATLLYTNIKYDKSDEILKKLGY
ncbi:MAG: OmpH family outer membrane protein [Bacteroidetes bacterium]|nr:MAG: OmpH family outer membrane protein [Bacteroidota bacterium]